MKYDHAAEARAQGAELLGPSERGKNYRQYRLACGHTQDVQAGKMRLGLFRCRQCQQDRLQAVAQTQGVKMLGPSTLGYNYRRYQFACGHVQDVQKEHIRMGKFTCQQCQQNKLTAEAQAQGAELLGPSERGKNYRQYRLACGHVQDIRAGHMRINEFTCQQCQQNTHIAEAQAQGAELLGPSERGKNYRQYRLACGHVQDIRAGHMRIGYFTCQQCEETHMDLPSEVYVILVEHAGAYYLKVGKGKPGMGRVSMQLNRANAEGVKLCAREFATGREALAFEQALHKAGAKHRVFKRKAPAWYPDGGTELWADSHEAQSLLRMQGMQF